MSLAVAIQMDHIAGVDIAADSTFVLGARSASARAWPLSLLAAGSVSCARAAPLRAPSRSRCATKRATTTASARPEVIDLATLDVVLMRQDPPFDMSYITATHILEHVHPDTLVVNDPGPCAQRARKTIRHAFSRCHAADPDHLGHGRDQRFPRQAQRHHRQAALRQRRGRRLPPQARRRESLLADGNVHRDVSRTGHRPALPARGARGR